MLDKITKRITDSVREERGFTLIELTVVVIVIGILVSIAIPVYLGLVSKAHVALVKSDVKSTITANVIRNAGSGAGVPTGVYSEGDNVGAADNSFNISKGVTITVTATEIQGTHAGLTGSWTYTKADGTFTGTDEFS